MINLSQYSKPLKRLFSLYVEDARLALTERLTLLMSSLVIGLFITLLVVAVIIFLSIAAASELRLHLSAVAAYSIVAGGYFILLILLILFRKQLIVNPIARLLSRVILPDPNEKTENDEQRQ